MCRTHQGGSCSLGFIFFFSPKCSTAKNKMQTPQPTKTKQPPGAIHSPGWWQVWIHWRGDHFVKRRESKELPLHPAECLCTEAVWGKNHPKPGSSSRNIGWVKWGVCSSRGICEKEKPPVTLIVFRLLKFTFLYWSFLMDCNTSKVVIFSFLSVINF